MIVVNVTYKMKEGVKPSDFVNALEENGLAPYCRQEEGNICYRYFYPADGKNEVFLLEKWENMELATAHSKNENFEKIGQVKAKYVENTDIKIYQE